MQRAESDTGKAGDSGGCENLKERESRPWLPDLGSQEGSAVMESRGGQEGAGSRRQCGGCLCARPPPGQ